MRLFIAYNKQHTLTLCVKHRLRKADCCPKQHCSVLLRKVCHRCPSSLLAILPNKSIQLQEEGLGEQPHRLLQLLLAAEHTLLQHYIRRCPLFRHYSPALAYPTPLEAQLVCFLQRVVGRGHAVRRRLHSAAL